MSYRIGSFNMMNLSYTSNREDDEIAKMIKSEKFDIVVMQEVLSEGKHINFIISRLKDWQYQFVDAKSTVDSRGEGYAFLWNNKRVNPVASNDNFTALNTRGNLLRHPGYARFTTKNTISGSFCVIRIISTHLCDKTVAERKEEFKVISTEVYPRIADKRYGDNMPAYTFLLGDYNLNIKNVSNNSPYLEELVEIPDNRLPRKIITVQEDKTSLKQEKDKLGNVFANNFDHFSYDEDRFVGIDLNYHHIDMVNDKKYYGGDLEKYREEISDHIPIKMDISFK